MIINNLIKNIKSIFSLNLIRFIFLKFILISFSLMYLIK